MASNIRQKHKSLTLLINLFQEWRLLLLLHLPQSSHKITLFLYNGFLNRFIVPTVKMYYIPWFWNSIHSFESNYIILSIIPRIMMCIKSRQLETHTWSYQDYLNPTETFMRSRSRGCRSKFLRGFAGLLFIRCDSISRIVYAGVKGAFTSRISFCFKSVCLILKCK